MKHRPTGSRAIVAAATMAMLVAIAPAPGMPSNQAFRVTSTLDGQEGAAAPDPRIARTSGPASEVVFLIDGKLR
jgi:hypothetical protein